jgi:hypothetical protein
MSHVFILGTDKRVICDKCGASEPVRLPVSIDAFVAFLRRFEQEHLHEEPQVEGRLKCPVCGTEQHHAPGRNCVSCGYGL